MRILIIAPVAPYDGIPHAGGQYLATYATGLRDRGVDVEIVAPEPIAPNRGPRGPNIVPVRLVPRAGARHPAAVLWAAGRHAWRAIDPGLGVVRGFEENRQFRELVASVDLIDIHWTEMLPLVPLLRRVAPRTPVFCTEYDVFTQAVRRAIHSPSPSQRAKAIVRYVHVSRREARLLNTVDRVYVFNRENVGLLKGMGVTTTVATTDLFVPVVAERPPLERRRVIFAGAFGRAENREAARWLTERVWPTVRAQIPEGELYLVGDGPREWARGLDGHSVHVTGRVPLLAPYYRDAGVACAPIQRGAGVKMKVLEGMAHGLPVVTTSVGSEGIVGDTHHPPPLVIADTPARFADALIQLLQDRAARVVLGRAGQRWVEGRYDSRRSITTLVTDMREACGLATGTADEIRACR